MTNAQLKQKAIQEAYGDKYPSLKTYIDEDGYCMMYDDKSVKLTPNFNELGFTKDYTETNIDSGVFPDGSLQWRPKSLAGIDTNNGWTRIEPDGSNLPVDDSNLYDIGKMTSSGTFFDVADKIRAASVKDYFESNGCTHYRPVVELPKPIY